MTTWLHFCDDPVTFELDAGAAQDVAAERRGIWLYRDLDDATFRVRAAEWGQDAVVIEAPDALVTLMQDDPTGDDPTRDEYFLPAEHFAAATIVRARYR